MYKTKMGKRTCEKLCKGGHGGGCETKKLQDLNRSLDEKEDNGVWDNMDGRMRAEPKDKLKDCLRKDEIAWRQCS